MKLVFATHNKNKFLEVKSILPEHFELMNLNDINCHEDIPETSNSIEGNALLKARYVEENYGFDCFADDTGLEVKSLNGAPGVYSARYAGPENDAQANIKKLLNNLQDKQDRTARFKTCIALIIDGDEILFEGICEGKITEEKQGEGGFGYDPVFLPDGYEATFSEMTLSLKNRIGHRGKAIQQLITYLKEL